MSNDLLMQKFIEKHVAIVEPLMREASLASWEMQTTSSEQAREKSITLNSQLAKVYANSDEYEFLKSITSSELKDPLLARQHTLLMNEYLSNQMSDSALEEIIRLEVEIEDSFNIFRAEVQGKPVSDNEIDETLLKSEDSALRKATWEASKTVGSEVEEKVLHLVRLRNREAQRLGFDNYYSMGLTLQELDETRLFAILDDLHIQSEPIWKSYKAELDTRLAERFQVSASELRPWHYSNRFFQDSDSGPADLDRFFESKNLEQLSADFFNTIGLSIDDLLLKADLYERDGKCQHAFCMDADRLGDVRVLCNNRPTEQWMDIMLHEFGHAVYDKFNDAELPFLLRCPAHTMTTESIALFMGRLSKNPKWLVRYAGVDPAEAKKISAGAVRRTRDHLLVFMRWCFVMANFERALYRDPDQNLNTLWWDLVEKYQSLIRPEHRNAPDWAAKVHIATAPVYYHNYQLGEMIASQLLSYLNNTVLVDEPDDALISSPLVGAYMKTHLFHPGAIRSWEDWLENATGEPLNPAYFVGQLE